MQLTGFASLINDYISSEIRDDIPPKMPSAPGVRQYTNIKQAQLIGFEAVYLQKLTARLQHRLSLAYTHGENKDSNEPLAEIPPLDFRYVLSGRYFNNRLRPQLNLRHAWQQKRVALSYGESSTPAFTLLDASINYQFNKFIESNLAIHNILDKTYYEHLSRSVKGSSEAIYAPGRSFVFTLVVYL
ncbi:TonB-dependent receptor domain-containing protein [Carboxylicivirga sp. M1479]|uniref:TonB-dependent receptor domain-containing protein n=1 Tax=Carboxylicivirga sp. M1479 TaxID=2594476 RepID=UPI0021053A0B|nr:TonB-dependent receptor [Carboxylicivirga sp. M1479]